MKMYICIYAHHAAHFYGGAFISLSLLLQWRSRTKLQGKGKIIWTPNFGKTFCAFLFWILPARSSTKDGNGEIHPYFATSKLHYRCQLSISTFNHVYFSSSPTTSSNVLYGNLDRTHWLLMLLNGGDPESHCLNQNIYDIDHLITISLFPSPD